MDLEKAVFPHAMQGRFLQMLMLMVCLIVGRAHGVELDPADGPHVDLKLALEEDALRMEVTMNIVFLDDIISFPRESRDRIDPIEGPELLDAIQAWADTELVARVDGCRGKRRAQSNKSETSERFL